MSILMKIYMTSSTSRSRLALTPQALATTSHSRLVWQMIEELLVRELKELPTSVEVNENSIIPVLRNAVFCFKFLDFSAAAHAYVRTLYHRINGFTLWLCATATEASRLNVQRTEKIFRSSWALQIYNIPIHWPSVSVRLLKLADSRRSLV